MEENGLSLLGADEGGRRRKFAKVGTLIGALLGAAGVSFRGNRHSGTVLNHVIGAAVGAGVGAGTGYVAARVTETP